jgi:hypothetical protein
MSELIVKGSAPPRFPWHGTPEERRDLNLAVIKHMGPCQCHPHSMNASGRVTAIHVCDGHTFLTEVDEPGRTLEWTGAARDGTFPHHVAGQLNTPVYRVDRLLFVKRTVDTYVLREHLGPCEGCGAPAVDLRSHAEVCEPGSEWAWLFDDEAKDLPW